MWTLGFTLVLSVAVSSGWPGHLERLGSHIAYDEVQTKRAFPLPLDFFRKYSQPGTPIIFKSVAGNARMRNWTDNYLIQNFGDEFVNTLDDKLMVKHGGRTKTRTLRAFLNSYIAQDIYMVQNISEAMVKDTDIPRSIQCGGFQNYVEQIALQISNQRTRSSLHLERLDNIRCVLDGTEDVILVNRKFKQFVEADGWNRNGVYSSMDVDAVDMDIYPKVRLLSTSKATLDTGDCLFIPHKWYRQINALGFRNMNVNYMFSHLPWFNHTNCRYVDLTQQMTPFHLFTETSRQHNIRFLSRLVNEPDIITKRVFLQKYVKEDTHSFEKDKIVQFIDLNHDNVLSWEELLSINVTSFMNQFYYQLTVSDSILEECFDCENDEDPHTIDDIRDEF